MQNEQFKIFLELYPNYAPQFKEISISEYVSNCVQAEKEFSDLDAAFKKDEGKSLFKTISEATGVDSLYTQSVSYYFNFCSYLIDRSKQIKDCERINLEANISEIENFTNLSNDQKLLLIKNVFKQGPYKTKLLEHWGGCSITGINNPSMLMTTFIKPFEECSNVEKFDIYNGLLLTPNYNKLFEEYLITFDSLGKIEISDTLNDKDLLKLGISRNDKLREDKFTMNHAYYFYYHKHLFLGDIIVF